MQVRPTPWDVRAALATAALAALLFALACLLTAATDEGSVRWAIRAARTLPVAPLCGAAVTYLGLRRARRRGELLALESIGCSPARAAAFAVAGAAALSVVCAAAVVTFRGGALDAFFPRAASRGEIAVVSDGFLDPARGVHVSPSGELSRRPKEDLEAAGPRFSGRAASAAGVLLALGAALPLLAARAAHGAHRREIAAAALTCVLCIFLLQAAASGRAPPALACVPATALLIFAAVRYRAAAW